MRRGAKPSKAKVESSRSAAPGSKNEGSRVTDLEKQLAEALKREAEAQEQQAATAKILQVISQSPTDVTPIFDTIVESAWRLCAATRAAVYRFDGSLVHFVAHHGYSAEALAIARALSPSPPDRSRAATRAIVDRTVVHIPDVFEDTEHRQPDLARAVGVRSLLGVPMLRDGEPLGAVFVGREGPGPFSRDQIALLQTFADQAVIAIENVRLFKELQEKNRALTQAHAQVTEALEQQTATSEVLKVMSRSAFDLGPVFATVVENAVRLCEAERAFLFRFDGEFLRPAASYNAGSEVQAFVEQNPIAPGRHSISARAALERRTVHVHDVQADPEYAYAVRDVDPIRTLLAVPMLKGNDLVGTITVYKLEVKPFTDKQIALVETFADQAVIAIENVRLFTELQTSNRELTTALDTQTATSDILRVISRSQTDVQPVFDAILTSAVRLLRGYSGTLAQIAGDQIELAAYTSTGAAGDAVARDASHRPLDSEGVHARTIRDRAPMTVANLQTDPRFPERVRAFARARGFLGVITVPLLRHGEALGSIAVARREPGEFNTDELGLLQTFADQAVIAIENVRLFKELEAKNRDLTTALDEKTATSEILRVISQSPTAVQPVFATIARNARGLCDADSCSVFMYGGDLIRLEAIDNATVEGADAIRRAYPLPPSRGHATGRAILAGRAVHIADVRDDPEYDLRGILGAGLRTIVSVPMLRDGSAIGAITLHTWETPRPFSATQVALIETFADQAVIAIENVRLFTELQDKNKALTQAHAQVTESLERQTATSEILRVISSAHTDAQPVFDTIVQSAVRLCKATHAAVFVTDGTMLHHPANYGSSSEALAAVRARFPQPITMESTPGITILTRSVLHLPDIDDPAAPESFRQAGRLLGFRSQVSVPMLRAGEAVGSIMVGRTERGRFADAEVELLKTFSDQAVIAIENVRLFKELEARTKELTRSVGKLTALGEVGRAVSSTLDLETVLTTIVSRAVELSGLDGGVVFEYDEGAEEFIHRVATEVGGALAEARRTTRVRKGEGIVGQTALTLEPAQVSDITVPGAYESRMRENLIESGVRAILAVPMVREGHLIGCLGVTRNHPGEFPAETIDLLRTFATQSALAIQNARLFREIEQKSRELEAASRHKSEFLANMSHELRTPLNAVIGFSEVLTERMFGELNEKQDEYLKDIHASGQHLLSLINDILDLSKIEAGKMELELSDFDLPMTIDNALMLVRERAARRGIELHRSVDERLGQVQADERKIRQVLLNLLSNAIKFTPEGGRIEVGAKPVNGSIEVSVSDTGVGIAPEDQEAVFEEFRQVGTADKKVEGTGLGLALSRKFIELHGGKIWVKSRVKEGSTFTFTIPVRRGE